MTDIDKVELSVGDKILLAFSSCNQPYLCRMLITEIVEGSYVRCKYINSNGTISGTKKVKTYYGEISALKYE